MLQHMLGSPFLRLSNIPLYSQTTLSFLIWSQTPDFFNLWALWITLPMLGSFMPSGHKLVSSQRRELQLGNCLHRTGLWVSL